MGKPRAVCLPMIGMRQRQPAGVDRLHIGHRQVVGRLAAEIERVQDQIQPAAGRAGHQRRRVRACDQVALVVAYRAG